MTKLDASICKERLYARDAVYKAAMDLVLNAEPSEASASVAVVRADLLAKLELALQESEGAA
jgi:hypothetical protein